MRAVFVFTLTRRFMNDEKESQKNDSKANDDDMSSTAGEENKKRKNLSNQSTVVDELT